MHIPLSSCSHKVVTSFIKKNQQLTIVFTLITSTILLCSCSSPYSALYGESPTKIKKDVHFLEGYRDTLCGIKEKHEYEEIPSGRCLALYFDFKDQSHTKTEMEGVANRVRSILEDPDKVDQSIIDQLSEATAEIAACKNYIKKTCM